MSRMLLKSMSTGEYQANAKTMTREGITREVEDCVRTGSCEGDPRNNIEWHKTKGWTSGDDNAD
ncbi:hypothetical protein Ami103574_00080 [Aminipila butyrica]|uniref:Uncharacterized protein n=1 Tax=Aminipila butyrica TaxID=433296 RepID=A0A858BPL4_9FIRM|nr:hypothetical protein [Aminipila butyrica]QIB67811.1 hypothetical protein Ami103574_00080 [Aminipila butyrica]